MTTTDATFADRWEASFQRRGDAECWPWSRGNSHGYGYIRYEGRRQGAHRVSYRLHHGPIPPGLFVDHICGVPLCVNPDHLRLLTLADNNRHTVGRPSRKRNLPRGVYLTGSGKWGAAVCHNRKQHWVGSYASIPEAAEAARLKRAELFGAHLEPSTAGKPLSRKKEDR